MISVNQKRLQVTKHQQKLILLPDLSRLVFIWLGITLIAGMVSIFFRSIMEHIEFRLIANIIVFLCCVTMVSMGFIKARFFHKRSHLFITIIIFVILMAFYAALIHSSLKKLPPELLPGEPIDHFYYWQQANTYVDFWRLSKPGNNDVIIQSMSNSWPFGYLLGWIMVIWGSFVEIPLYLAMTALFLTGILLGTVCLQLGYHDSVARRAYWIWIFLAASPQIIKPALWKDNWLWLMLVISISGMVTIAKGKSSVVLNILVLTTLFFTILFRWLAAISLAMLIFIIGARFRRARHLILVVAVVAVGFFIITINFQLEIVSAEAAPKPIERVAMYLTSLFSFATSFELEGQIRSQLWGVPLSLSNLWYVMPLRFIEPFIQPSGWLPPTRTFLQSIAFLVTHAAAFGLTLLLFFVLVAQKRQTHKDPYHNLSRYLCLAALPLIFSTGIYPAASDRYIYTGLIMALPVIANATSQFKAITRMLLFLGALLELFGIFLYIYLV